MTVKLCTNSKHPFSDTEQFTEWGKYRPVFPFNTWLLYAKVQKIQHVKFCSVRNYHTKEVSL